jgi:UPF0755 protein
MEPTSVTPQAPGLRRYLVRGVIVAVILLATFLAYANEPPGSFPVDVLVTIHSGDTLNSVAKDLKADGLIRSTTLFQSVVVLFAGEQKLVAGDYYFGTPISAYGMASRLVKGDFNLTPIKVTFPEGLSMSQIAALLAPKLKDFSATDFLKFSPEKEGFLFPDTYFFMPNTKAAEVIDVLQKNFDEKIKPEALEIVAFGKSEKEVITMASILEKEAQTPEDWQIISGILWKRIKIGMPLQVDSTLGYVTNKTSAELTSSDLKMNSPYNTYTTKGLPPTPIANPGLETIEAAITPTTTPYLYYLSDKNGVIHYAATFADHIKNRQKYLR